MSLLNFGDLKTAIAGYSGRGDLTSTGANFARVLEFIDLAETRMNRDLARISAGEVQTQQLATVAGVETVDLPQDFNGSRRMVVVDASHTWTVPYATPEELLTEFPTTAQGRPRKFTFIGKDGASDTLQAHFRPIPDAAYVLWCVYYRKVPTMVGAPDTFTNWMMTVNPDAYLYASLIEEALWEGNGVAMQQWATAYGKALEDLKGLDKKRSHSGSALRVPSMVPMTSSRTPGLST